MRRMRLLALLAVLLVTTAGCAHGVAVRQLDTVPASVNVGGGVEQGGEPGVGWGPTKTTFYVADLTTGICTGIPTGVSAPSRHRIVVSFSRSNENPCPLTGDVVWELAVPSGVDAATLVHVELDLPGGGHVLTLLE